MKHVFILNPAAGKRGGAGRLAGRIRAACGELGLDYALLITEQPGDALRFTRALVDQGRETRVYACGGDGTLWAVVQAAAGVPYIAVTNIPNGTGNDFLKIFGPQARKGFQDIAALAEGPQAALDLMDCNGRLGLDVVCAGLDARVAADVGRYKALPLVTGMGAYILSLGENVLLKGLGQPMRVSMGGQSWDEPVSVLCICNGRYYGGGFMPVGEAMPNDGILDALLVPQVSLPTFVRLVGAYAKGQYARYPDLITPYHGPGPITYESLTPIITVIDGEVFRDTAFTVTLSDKKLNFFHPAHLSWSLNLANSTKAPAGIC